MMVLRSVEKLVDSKGRKLDMRSAAEKAGYLVAQLDCPMDATWAEKKERRVAAEMAAKLAMLRVRQMAVMSVE